MVRYSKKDGSFDIGEQMNNKEYGDLVNQGNFPEEIKVPLDPPFIDNRGTIQNLLLSPVNGVSIITSKAGSVRSNHFHIEDFHHLYVLSGSMEYYERNINEDGSHIKPIIIKAGEMVFTAPGKVHKTVFIEDTVLISLSKRPRDHESHEEDVVRIEF